MDVEDQKSFLNYLLNERQLGERTAVIYMTFHRLFDPLKLSQDYIDYFVIEHRNTSTVRAFVKHYLEFQGIPDMFVLPKKPIGRKAQKIIRSLTPQQINITRAYFYSVSFKNGLLFDLLYEGAMRRVEIISITLGSFFWNEWFDNVEGFCKLVIRGKGNKERIVLINPETMQKILGIYVEKYQLYSPELIKEFMESHKESLLFRTKKGNPLNEKNVYDIIKRNSKKAIGRDIRPHELRHCRATDLEKRGVPIRDIKNYLGHSKIATTEIYLHKSGEESIETIERALNERKSSA